MQYYELYIIGIIVLVMTCFINSLTKRNNHDQA